MLDHRDVSIIAGQRRAELRREAAECRRAPRHRLLPRWHVSWSRARLSPAAEKGSSLVIIISASRIG